MLFEIKAKKEKVPLLNENWVTADIGESVFSTQPFDYKTFMNYIKKTPEAIGIIRAMSTDILSDGVIWHGGKNKIKKSQEFCTRTELWTRKLPGALIDWFIFGNCLLWKGFSPKRLKEITERVVNYKMPEFKEEIKQAIINDTINDVNLKTMDIRSVPWSTVSIVNSATDITGYKQQVTNGAAYRRWSPDEVIHATLMDVDGKVYGFSPMVAATSVITTLCLIKDHNGYYFDNGGEPDLMFMFPQEYQDNPQIESLRRMLQEKKDSRNKRGHMIITGECKIQRVNDRDKDMEYRLLSIYLTGVLAFSFNMPMARIKAIIGAEVRGQGSSDELSEAGYWRNISHMQKYWEEMLNEHVFKPVFGTWFEFKRAYKQDEVRESQTKLLAVNWLQSMASGLKLKPKKDMLKRVLDLDEDDVDWNNWEKITAEQIVPPEGQQPQAPNATLFRSETQQAADEIKRKRAMQEQPPVP